MLAGTVAMLFTLPQGSNQELLLGVLGLVVTGSIALSSQSIIANGMAGLMLRVVSDYKPGDFIEVGEHEGRVSEMALLHTEIQTSQRNLTTLPNALLITQPVTVVRSSGTVVSATVSIGYDVSHHWLEPLFVAATAHADLEEGFIQIVDLGNYSVTYRVAGFLGEPSRLLRARSQLRMAILDTLHAADVEIMSPMYVSRRQASDELVVPDANGVPKPGPKRRTAEDRVFDKAELAGGIEAMKTLSAEIAIEIEDLEQLVDKAAESEERTALEQRLASEQRRLAAIDKRAERLREKRDEA